MTTAMFFIQLERLSYDVSETTNFTTQNLINELYRMHVYGGPLEYKWDLVSEWT